MLRAEDARRYSWADDDYDLAWTMAVATGRGRDDVIRAYGGDPEQEPEQLRFADARVPSDKDLGVVSLVQVREVGPHILMIENNGWLGKAKGIAERASAGGAHFVCIYWSANANSWIAEARDGVLLANFDPAYIADDPAVPFTPPRELPSTWETYPDWINDVELPVEEMGSVMLAIVEQQTGLAFDRAWLDEPTPTYRIPYPGAGRVLSTPRSP